MSQDLIKHNFLEIVDLSSNRKKFSNTWTSFVAQNAFTLILFSSQAHKTLHLSKSNVS